MNRFFVEVGNDNHLISVSTKQLRFCSKVLMLIPLTWLSLILT